MPSHAVSTLTEHRLFLHAWQAGNPPPQSASSIHARCNPSTYPSCKQLDQNHQKRYHLGLRTQSRNDTRIKKAPHSQRSPSNGCADLFRFGPMKTRWRHSLQLNQVLRSSSITTCLSCVAFMGRRPKKSQYVTGRFPCLNLEHLGENKSYQLFLGSPSTQQWCHEHGLSVCNVVDEICRP